MPLIIYTLTIEQITEARLNVQSEIINVFNSYIMMAEMRDQRMGHTYCALWQSIRRKIRWIWTIGLIEYI